MDLQQINEILAIVRVAGSSIAIISCVAMIIFFNNTHGDNDFAKQLSYLLGGIAVYKFIATSTFVYSVITDAGFSVTISILYVLSDQVENAAVISLAIFSMWNAHKSADGKDEHAIDKTK